MLLYLFGASPVVCGTFVQGRQHALQPLGSRAMYLPHATSLRMGRLGYQSDAQSTLAVSYNGLEGYAASLQDALTRPWPAYEAIGIQAPSGDYNQLAVTLLQIENEFYGTIRPKRVIEPGERPLHALRARGVEYVEVRLMDLNPFLPLGIDEQTMRFLDVFLLHCLLSDSPPDSPAEIEALKRNQHLVAERGREPGLKLACGGMEVALTDWAAQVLGELPALARALDEALGGDGHQAAVQAAQQALHNPALLPSARVLAALPGYGDSYVAFMLDRSQQIRSLMLAQPPGAALRQRFAEMAVQSRAQQHAIEVSDTLSFEQYRREYTSPARLSPQA